MANSTKIDGESRDGYFATNEILGYAPVQGKTVTSRKYSGQQLIYDVTYTINELGLRISSSEAVKNDACVLFFGGSFTFGEGVNDSEAMPYVVQKLSKLRVHNFGFHGYGPHQMLSAIQHGIVQNSIDCHPQVVIYQALVEHIARSAGFSSWDYYGPKYILQSDGSVRYAGHFNDWISRKVLDLLAKSFAYKRFLENRTDIDEKDLELFIEIIAASRDLLIELYPAAQFHVIYWDRPDHMFNEAVIAGLRRKDIHIHFINEILPDYPANKYRYIFDKNDGHPNPEGHQRIAQYVVERLIPMK